MLKLLKNVLLQQINLRMGVIVKIKDNIMIKNLLLIVLKVKNLNNLECPNATYPHNGLCMACTPNCVTCQEDNFYRSFL